MRRSTAFVSSGAASARRARVRRIALCKVLRVRFLTGLASSLLAALAELIFLTPKHCGVFIYDKGPFEPRCAEHTLPRAAAGVEAAAEAADDQRLGMLWRVMLKYGVPPKLVDLLMALHDRVLVKFEVDGVEKTLDSIIGVKQGDLLGPELFIFFMAAVMETWRLHHDFDLCAVRSKSDFVLTGRRPSGQSPARLPSHSLS